MTTFSLLVDGERLLRVDSEADVRAWVATYCEEHAADDPDAAHVQIIERGALAWLTGGRLVDRTRFF